MTTPMPLRARHPLHHHTPIRHQRGANTARALTQKRDPCPNTTGQGSHKLERPTRLPPAPLLLLLPTANHLGPGDIPLTVHKVQVAGHLLDTDLRNLLRHVLSPPSVARSNIHHDDPLLPARVYDGSLRMLPAKSADDTLPTRGAHYVPILTYPTRLCKHAVADKIARRLVLGFALSGAFSVNVRNVPASPTTSSS